MAVERLTDYTRRIWTALGPDAPEGHDFEVGDVIYYMDSSQCGIVTYVYPEGSIDVEFLPDVGGGGGGGGLQLLGSGTYIKPSQSTSLSIPVTYTGDPKLFYMYVPELVANTGQTVFGARWMDLENAETDPYTHNGSGFSMYSAQNTTNAIVWGAPTNVTWPALTANTMTFGRVFNYANYLANTYKWFIYG